MLRRSVAHCKKKTKHNSGYVQLDKRYLILKMKSCNVRTFLLYAILFAFCGLVPLTLAEDKSRNNRPRQIDVEHEDDIGQSLTLPNSEHIALVPDEDENREDEKKAQLDEDEDLEDLKNIRVMRVEEDIVHDRDDVIVKNITTKSQTVKRLMVGSVTQSVQSESNGTPSFTDDIEDHFRNRSQSASNNLTRSRPMTMTTRRHSYCRTFHQLVDVTVQHRKPGFSQRPKANYPPEITLNPKAESPYKVGDYLELQCRANGTPEYVWKKNGQPVLDGTIINGNLIFNKTEASSTGEYQCFAMNNFGTAVSTKALVKKAELLSFPTLKDPTLHRPEVGNPLTLRCNPPLCYPTGVIYWSEATPASKLKPIENTERISLDYDGNLHFANVMLDDARQGRKYVCTVSNTVLRALMQGDDQIIEPQPVKGEPRYVEPALMWSSTNNTKHITLKHRLLKMKCIFSGYPTPTVTWRRVNDSNSPRVYFPNESFGQEMVIDSVEIEDQGTYECAGSNNAGRVSKQFSIVVESAPFWSDNKSPENQVVVEEESAQFNCSAHGFPGPEISWSINAVPVEELPPDSRRVVSKNSITFNNVTQADTMVIQCLAQNKHGSILSNAYLTVRAEIPELTERPDREVKVAEGHDVVFKCAATGAPKPVISWLKGNQSIEPTHDRMKVQPNGYLEIKNVLGEDDDIYTCQARNKFGVDKASGHLLVRSKTQITVPPKSQVAIARSNVTLECSVNTDPEEEANLVIQWFQDGKPIDVSAGSRRIFYNAEDFSLTIFNSSVTDSAKYMCHATNGLDSDQYSATVVIKDRPEAPQTVDLTSCDGPTTTLSWQPGSNNNDAIVEYIISYKSSLNESGSVNVSNLESLRAIVPLKPWRSYTFQITARNGVGLSDPSILQAEVCVTPPAIPLRNPSGVCSEMRCSKCLVILWEPLTIDAVNGKDFHYLVSYKRLDIPNAPENKTVIQDWRRGEVVIYDLEEFKKFEIYVQSVNEVGPSTEELQRKIAFSSEGMPIISPQNFRINNETLNSSAVEFLWDPIDESSELIKGFFKGYQVQFWKTDEKETLQRIDIILKTDHNLCPDVNPGRRRRRRRESRTLSVSTNNLWPFSTISAGVAVLNGVRTGVLCSPITFVSPEGIPGPVTIFRVTEIGSFHFQLLWSPPFISNGIITGYNIMYYIMLPCVGLAQNDFIQNPLQLKAMSPVLNADCYYNVSISAMTSAGLGDPVFLQAKTFISAPPDKPLISSHEVGENYVNISWLPHGIKPVNPGTKYYVEYRKDDKENNYQKTPPVDKEENWANITDLESGSQYVFTVVAANHLHETKSNELKAVIGQESVIAPVVVNVASTGWFIALLIIIAVIILIIIITLIICTQHPGGKYPVWKTEKEQGKAVPEEEAQFGEYIRRPDTNHVNNRFSLISNSTECSEDGDSIGEYEDPETAKFNEDGSFIGQYAPKRKHDPPPIPANNVLHTFM